MTGSVATLNILHGAKELADRGHELNRIRDKTGDTYRRNVKAHTSRILAESSVKGSSVAKADQEIDNIGLGKNLMLDAWAKS